MNIQSTAPESNGDARLLELGAAWAEAHRCYEEAIAKGALATDDTEADCEAAINFAGDAYRQALEAIRVTPAHTPAGRELKVRALASVCDGVADIDDVIAGRSWGGNGDLELMALSLARDLVAMHLKLPKAE